MPRGLLAFLVALAVTAVAGSSIAYAQAEPVARVVYFYRDDCPHCIVVIEEVLENLTETGEFDRAVDSIVEGKLDPYSACDNLLLPALGESSGGPVKG